MPKGKDASVVVVRNCRIDTKWGSRPPWKPRFSLSVWPPASDFRTVMLTPGGALAALKLATPFIRPRMGPALSL